MSETLFTVTPAAAMRILQESGSQAETLALRVAAKRGNDGGLLYGMGFDEQREEDHVFECEGVTLLIAPMSHEFLSGATLDFVELAPGEFQFIFINPHETETVPGSGCGSAGGGCSSRGCGSGCG